MAVQENTKPTSEHDRDGLNEASMDLGRAWGLAETLCAQSGERPGEFDIEGVTRVIHSLVGQAKGRVSDGSIDLEIGAALAVCDLVLVDSQDAGHEPNSPSSWALEAMPFAIQRAKQAVDSMPWGGHLKAA